MILAVALPPVKPTYYARRSEASRDAIVRAAPVRHAGLCARMVLPHRDWPCAVGKVRGWLCLRCSRWVED